MTLLGGSLEQAVKQRIVGTVVLLALGLLVVPVLFNSSSEPPVVIDQTIPTPPQTAIAPVEPIAAVAPPPAPVSAQFAVADEQPAPPPAAAPAPVAPAAVKSEPVIPAKAQAPSQMTQTAPQAGLKPNGLPQGYVVQVGSFKAQSNAEQLLQKLKAKGFQAYSSRTKSGAHAVLVGPHIDRQQAQRTAQNLKRDLGLDSMIKPFQP